MRLGDRGAFRTRLSRYDQRMRSDRQTRRDVIASLLRSGRPDLANVIANGRRPAVILLFPPIRPIRQIITRVLKRLQIDYQYEGRKAMRHHGAERGHDEPRFYLDINDTQASQITEMIVREQKKAGWVRGWEMYQD